jgi:hypothetical protein
MCHVETMTSTMFDRAPTARKPAWAPRIWEGCDFFAWLRLLYRNRFAVHPAYWYIAIIVTFVSFVHTMLRLVQEVLYGSRIRHTPLTKPPLFILGHWRTGTTFLHELLVQDRRHAYPTTYECLDPNDFLLTEPLVTRWLSFLMPSQRPMDNMKAGFDRPQEDEFALCMFGPGSPYLTIAFPNHPPQGQEFLDLDRLPRSTRRWWQRSYCRFIRQVAFRNPAKRLVLKSPPHTCRINALQELFPGALFVHIVRDPYVVWPSTVNLWKTLYRVHGLQKPTFVDLEEQVFATGLHLYDRLESTRSQVDPSRFFELHYEDLVKDPLGQLEALYTHLGLGGFEEMKGRVQRYLETVAGYETNRYQLEPDQRAEIGRRWEWIIRRYGYDTEPARLHPSPSPGANGVAQSSPTSPPIGNDNGKQPGPLQPRHQPIGAPHVHPEPAAAARPLRDS